MDLVRGLVRTVTRLTLSPGGQRENTEKRRRTIGPAPGTPSGKQDTEHEYLPMSEPQEKKAQQELLARMARKKPSELDSRFGQGSRKRGREEDLDDGFEYTYTGRVTTTEEGDGNMMDFEEELEEQLYVDMGVERMPSTDEAQETRSGEVKEEFTLESVEYDDTSESFAAQPSAVWSDGEEADAENSDAWVDEGVTLGNTTIEENEISPGDSASQLSAAEDEEEELDEAETDVGEGADAEDNYSDAEEDVEETTREEDEQAVGVDNDQDEEKQKRLREYLARQAELLVMKEQFQKTMAGGDWHTDELYLFERLGMRSFEPIFPARWQREYDMRTMNPSLFFQDDKDKALFNANHTSDVRAISALHKLFDLGMRVQDIAERNSVDLDWRAPSRMAQHINDYIKWSHADAGIKGLRYFPVLVVVQSKPRKSTQEYLQKSLRDQLSFSAQQYRNLLRLPDGELNPSGDTAIYRSRPPILYGIILAKTHALIYTWDSAKLVDRPKLIAPFNFTDPASTWNGMAIAIVVIMARNYLMSIKHTLEEDDSSSDPDA